VDARHNVTKFQNITGRDLIIIPKMNQHRTPRQNDEYMSKDIAMAGVGFMLQIRITPGINANVVKAPAIKPKISDIFIDHPFLF